MATKSKKVGAGRKPSVAPMLPDSTCPQYVRLRTLLDSVEIGSIRYYLDGTDPWEKNKHFEALEPLLMNVINLVFQGPKKITCPPGYSNCNGVCVPYQCYSGG
jgi:hypothetical protein